MRYIDADKELQFDIRNFGCYLKLKCSIEIATSFTLGHFIKYFQDLSLQIPVATLENTFISKIILNTSLFTVI